MKKNLIGMSIFVAVAFSACAQSRKAATEEASDKSINAHVSSVKMSRSACFGRCPVYDVTISNGGTITYNGKKFTGHDGVYTTTGNKKDIDALFASIESYHVDTCSDKYNPRAADLPGTHFEFVIDGSTKTIRNANFGPYYFKALQQEIEAMAQVDGKWKKIADSKED